jgi:hypothetical protein
VAGKAQIEDWGVFGVEVKAVEDQDSRLVNGARLRR